MNPITPESYPTLVLVFERPGMSPTERRCHAALGLASEFTEYNFAHSHTHEIEELGDMMWFCALAMDVDKGPFVYDLEPSAGTGKIPTIAWTIGEYCNLAKRDLAYNKPDPAMLHTRARQIYELLWSWSGAVDIAAANIRKLATRYAAGKFSFESALARNVAAEYAAMEAK